MLEQLKKQSMRFVMKRIGIAVAILIIILIAFGTSLRKQLEGPEDFATLSADKLQGAYVDAEINFILDVFAETYVEEDDGTESTTDYYYVIPAGDYGFIGLHVAADNSGTADQILDDTYEYLTENTDEFPETWKITGTINKLEGEYLDYYHDWFKSGFLGDLTQEEIDTMALPYVLEVDYVGGHESYIVGIVLAVFIVLFLYAIIILIKGLTGAYISPVKKYLKKNTSDIALEQMESDYVNGKSIGSIKIGNIWTFFFKGSKAHIIKNEDLIWVYRQNMAHRVYGFKVYENKLLVMYTRNKKKYVSTMGNIYDIDSAVETLSSVQPHIVTGYSKELEKCFKKDFETFVNIPYTKGASTDSHGDSADSNGTPEDSNGFSADSNGSSKDI